MAKYDSKKNLPVTEFTADSTKRADGLNGPEEILKTFVEIIKMFDPSSTHCDSQVRGGISADNLRDEIITEKHLTAEIIAEKHLTKEIKDMFTNIFSELTTILESLEYDEDVIEEILEKLDGLSKTHQSDYNAIVADMNTLLENYKSADSTLKEELEGKISSTKTLLESTLEKVANKTNSISKISPSEEKYTSEKAVVNYVKEEVDSANVNNIKEITEEEIDYIAESGLYVVKSKSTTEEETGNDGPLVAVPGGAGRIEYQYYLFHCTENYVRDDTIEANMEIFDAFQLRMKINNTREPSGPLLEMVNVGDGILDSRVKANGEWREWRKYLTSEDVDDTPTEGSDNLITSGSLYEEKLKRAKIQYYGTADIEITDLSNFALEYEEDGVTPTGNILKSDTFDDNLTELVIPYELDGVTITGICIHAFYDRQGLTSIIIPNGVTSIGPVAFGNCESLVRITIPDSVTNIGDGAFSYCYSLTNITVPDGVTNIWHRMFEHCASLTSLTIPNSVTNIDDGAFHTCHNLTSITIPDSVTNIGDSAFAWCDSLTSITIPDSVTSIGNDAFNGCSFLTNVIIGNSVISIGNDAFKYIDSEAVFYVYPDSYAETYCKENGYNYMLLASAPDEYQLIGETEITEADITEAGETGITGITVELNSVLGNYRDIMINIFIPKNTLNTANGTPHFATGKNIQELSNLNNAVLSSQSETYGKIYYNYSNPITIKIELNEERVPFYVQYMMSAFSSFNYPSNVYAVSGSDINRSLKDDKFIFFKARSSSYSFPAGSTMKVYAR